MGFFSSKILHDFGSPGEYEFPHPRELFAKGSKNVTRGEGHIAPSLHDRPVHHSGRSTGLVDSEFRPV